MMQLHDLAARASETITSPTLLAALPWIGIFMEVVLVGIALDRYEARRKGRTKSHRRR